MLSFFYEFFLCFFQSESLSDLAGMKFGKDAETAKQNEAQLITGLMSDILVGKAAFNNEVSLHITELLVRLVVILSFFLYI